MTVDVLVVDDSAANVKLLRVVLEREGYRVRAATDAEEALRMLSTFRPSLVLTDVQLPGMDGLELTRRMRAEVATKDLVVLALTASATREGEAWALAAGCDGYVAKPIDVGALPAMIAEHLAARQAKP